MKLAFKKPMSKAEHFISWYTAPFTWKFSKKWKQVPCHVEVIVDDSRALENIYMMFSARNTTGCIFRTRKLSKNHWEIVAAPPELSTENMIKACKHFEFDDYDWKGLFLDSTFSWLGLGFHDENKWYCSEVTSEILGLEDNSHTPAWLWFEYKD